MKKFHRTVGISTLCLIAMIIANYTLWMAITDLSTVFRLDILPPWFVFGIARWTIYIWVTIAILTQWSRRVDRNKSRIKFSQLFWLSCLLNIARLWTTYIEAYVLSIAILWFLFFCIFLLVKRLLQKKEKLHLDYITLVPFSLYLWRLTLAFFVLWIGQFLALWWSTSFVNTLPISSLLLLFWIIATLLTIKKTTPWTWLLPIFALSTLMIQLMSSWKIILGSITTLWIIIILGYIVKHYVDFLLK